MPRTHIFTKDKIKIFYACTKFIGHFISYIVLKIWIWKPRSSGELIKFLKLYFLQILLCYFPHPQFYNHSKNLTLANSYLVSSLENLLLAEFILLVYYSVSYKSDVDTGIILLHHFLYKDIFRF